MDKKAKAIQFTATDFRMPIRQVEMIVKRYEEHVKKLTPKRIKKAGK